MVGAADERNMTWWKFTWWRSNFMGIRNAWTKRGSKRIQYFSRYHWVQEIFQYFLMKAFLPGFKKRHDIAFKKASGESKSVDQTVCNQWTEDLPNLLKGYDPDDIYNVDETALFFKCLPDKTFTFKGEKCHGGKQSKERLTVLQCVNMTGTGKLPLFIIGKSKQPRCFKASMWNYIIIN